MLWIVTFEETIMDVSFWLRGVQWHIIGLDK